jgi:hypothetical protein
MFKSISKKVLAFNIASVLIIASAAAMQVRSLLFPGEPAPCSTRLQRSVMLALEGNGRRLQPSDIQAVTNGADLGVLDNLSIVPVRQAPTTAALDVFIANGSSQQGQVGGGGISFPWQPRSLPGELNQVCMAYNVFLPEDFDFGEGGTLPGVRGASRSAAATDRERFSTHLVWVKDGAPRMHTTIATSKGRSSAQVEPRKPVSIPRGRWVRVEQEVVLNAPGYADGGARFWIDGKFVNESHTAAYRFSPDSHVNGVGVDVYFGGQPFGNDWGRGQSPKDQRIQISGIEVRWN